jgi:hypothetical protein
MVLTLNMSVVTFSLIYLAWLVNRYRLQLLIDQAALLKARVAAQLQGDSYAEMTLDAASRPATTD